MSIVFVAQKWLYRDRSRSLTATTKRVDVTVLKRKFTVLKLNAFRVFFFLGKPVANSSFWLVNELVITVSGRTKSLFDIYLW